MHSVQVPRKHFKEGTNRSVMETHEITEHITLVKGKNHGRFPFSHSILIEDDVTALIDTGCGIETLSQLKKKVDIVINSHSHPDHTAGNWLFSRIPLRVPEEEVDFNSDIEKLSERYTEKGELSRMWRDFVSQKMNFRNASPTETFSDTDVLDFGDTALEAIHTPGHTVGHYCFFERSQKILFSFDIDFTRFGPWYGHRESDITQFKASVEKVKSLEPDTVVSSHTGIIREDIGKRFEQFSKVFCERDRRILEFLERERTLGEIVEKALIYGDFSFHPVLLRYWEEMMVKKHLKCLMDAGRVKRTERGFLAGPLDK